MPPTFKTEDLRFARFLTTLCNPTYYDKGDRLGPAKGDNQHIIRIYEQQIEAAKRIWASDGNVGDCNFNRSEIVDACRAWFEEHWKRSQMPKFSTTIDHVWSRYKSRAYTYASSLSNIPASELATREWLFHRWILWLIRRGVISLGCIDVTEPRSWTHEYRAKFCKDLEKASAFNKGLTDPQFRLEYCRFIHAAGALSHKLNSQTEQPGHRRNEDFDLNHVWRAIHQFIKWGFIHGEYAHEFIKLDGEQLDVAENMEPGSLKGQLCARKDRKWERGDTFFGESAMEEYAKRRLGLSLS